MRNPPKEVMAEWPKPNHIDPVHRGPALLIVETAVMALAVLMVLTRLYIRIFRVNKCGLDDWLMFVAMIFGIGVTVCVILAAELYGWNIHVWDLTKSQAENGRQVSLAAQTLFLFASGIPKISILVTYLRIAPKNSWLRRNTYALIGLVIATITAFLCILYTQCRPIKAYWLLTGSENCIAEGPAILAQGIVTVLIDFLVCVVPIPTLIGLKLPLSQRIALIVLFSLGFVVVIASCMRAYWAHYVTNETYDVTWEGFYLWIWTAVEANLGVICGCVPALRPLFRSVFRSKSSSYYNRYNDYHAYNHDTADKLGSSTTTKVVAPNTRNSVRSWTDNLQRGSKGMRIMDDEIGPGRGRYSKRQTRPLGPKPIMEMESWPSPNERLDDKLHSMER